MNSNRMCALALAFILAGCDRPNAGSPATKIDGEWAVEWEDPEKKETEIFYVWFSQRDSILSGSALDPNLIPATISGELDDLSITFLVDPQDGEGWAAAPTSTFKGRITAASAMEGRWSFSLFDRGTWKAWPTRAAAPSVKVTAETVVAIKLTSDEYDRLTHAKTEEELKLKQSRRAGDGFELQLPIGHLAGWLYYCRLLRDSARIMPSSPESMGETRLQEKILRALNENGYPWTRIPR